MYKIKVPVKKLLSEPDELTGHASRIVRFIQARLPLVAMIAGGVLLTAVIAGGYLYYQAEAEEEPRRLFDQAMGYFRGMLTSTGVADQDLQRAAATFHVVVERFPSSRVAPFAQFYAGVAAAEMRDYAAAIRDHEEFLRRFAGHSELMPFVYQQLGYARLGRGEPAEALKAFQAVLSMNQALTKDQAYEEIGRIYIRTGQREAALTTYQELIKTFPESPLATEAAVVVKGLTAALESRPVPSPRPAP